jgi:hypothetical protein
VEREEVLDRLLGQPTLWAVATHLGYILLPTRQHLVQVEVPAQKKVGYKRTTKILNKYQ